MEPLLGHELTQELASVEPTPLTLVPDPSTVETIGFTADVVSRLSAERDESGHSITGLAERARRRLAESA